MGCKKHIVFGTLKFVIFVIIVNRKINKIGIECIADCNGNTLAKLSKCMPENSPLLVVKCSPLNKHWNWPRIVDDRI